MFQILKMDVLFYDDKGNVVRYYGEVDFQADSTHLPLKDGGVGALFANALEPETREKTIEEAYRVLEPNGLLFWQGGSQNDLDLIQQKGFRLQECWKLINRETKKSIVNLIAKK